MAGLAWLGWRAISPAEPQEGGPLDIPPEHGYMFVQSEGTRFTDALETLVVKGDRPIVLESVELVGDEGLRLLGFKLAGPARKLSLDYFPDYPPTDALARLGAESIIDGPGAVLEPTGDGPRWELLVGIEITEPGPLWREGLRINYSVDGKKYTAFLPAQIQVCTDVRQKGPGGKCRG